MVDSIDFAKIIVNRINSLNENKGKEEKISLGETKLHKLLYICDGFLLAADTNIINENAKAWNYGPVYPRVNNWLKKASDVLNMEHKLLPDVYSEVNNSILELIDAVIGSFGNWSVNELSNWSHCPGSPWEMALKRGKGVMNSVIDKNDMKKYFRETFSDNS